MTHDPSDVRDDPKTAEFLVRPTPPPEVNQEKLLVLSGHEAGNSCVIEGVVTIGRDPDCSLSISESSVSRRHAKVVRTERGSLRLEDLGSRNGTFLNGMRIRESVALRRGDHIDVGGVVTVLVAVDSPLEEGLRRRQKMELVGRMAAGIAHDFNNLVGAAVTTHSHLRDRLAKLQSDAEVDECCRDLSDLLDRAADLTRSLSALGRRREARPEPMDVGEICEEVARLCQRTFGPQYTIHRRMAGDLVILGDRTELHQVLLNLFLNARDAMPDGGKLWVEAHVLAGSRLRLVVGDTGIGMSAEVLEHAFDAFFTTKSSGRGTGLGLATVAELIGGMGGSVEVESGLNEGTKFLIDLPLFRGARPARRPPSVTGGRPSDAGTLRGRVIVADDQDLVRRAIGRILSSVGHEVLFARSGSEALSLYRSTVPKPDVLVVDLEMGSHGGEHVLAAVRDGSPAVIVVSGHWDPTGEVEILELGAAAYLPKPIDTEILRDTVARLLAQRRSR